MAHRFSIQIFIFKCHWKSYQFQLGMFLMTCVLKISFSIVCFKKFFYLPILDFTIFDLLRIWAYLFHWFCWMSWSGWIFPDTSFYRVSFRQINWKSWEFSNSSFWNLYLLNLIFLKGEYMIYFSTCLQM